MSRSRNTLARKINVLLARLSPEAGQKAHIGWQGLPGAGRAEAIACR
jgi:putative protein kinase ArgK-like GTPase of G3E family